MRLELTRCQMALAATQLGGNLVLMLLGYYWLGIGESRAATLAWSAFLALLLLCLAGLLHGAAFVYFAEPIAGVKGAFRTAGRNLLPITAVVIAVLVLYFLIARLSDFSAGPAFQLSSWLTLKLRKPVKPNSVLRVFHAIFWLVRWVVLPVFLLPLFAGIATHGWRGARAIGQFVRERMFWWQAPLLLLLALWAPPQLVVWIPNLNSFVLEMLSFVVRILVAYLLFIASWLALAFRTSAGRPVVSQPRTVVSP